MVRSHNLPPDVFERLAALADNLWWTWNPMVERLFASLEPREWAATQHSPHRTLQRLTAERRSVLLEDPNFERRVADCERALADYLAARTWYQRTASRRDRRLLVAYFSAEYALHESLPIYSGGLGVLAADHLKSASDLGVPLVGLGLFYQHGYYRQELLGDGATRVVRPRLDAAYLPLSDSGVRVEVPIGQRVVHARVWQVRVGRVPLYLLDTDLRENARQDRTLTHYLYGGDDGYRIQQEILLGVGGLLVLDQLGLKPSVFHLNEGHAAFCSFERYRRLRRDGCGEDAAIERVRESTVFTTHTPVPAGHDRFSAARVTRQLGAGAREAGIDRHELLGLGRVDPDDDREPFCMTVLALHLAKYCNGVSEIHGDVTRRMWADVYGCEPDQVPIEHVTNGIHSQTWLAADAEPIYERYLAPDWLGAGPEQPWWERVNRIPDAELWQLRNRLRRRLVAFVRERLTQQLLRAGAPRDEVLHASSVLDEGALTIGFARRFATYKRAPLVFKSIKRLAQILSDPDRPVQLIFSGKAHPADEAGQQFVQQVVAESRRKQLRSRVVFIEDYDMHVGRMLTSGCDVWLNNPRRPFEASGTSGMKPPLHGGINCSVLDGWWPEAFDGTNGWEIGGGRELSTPQKQDAHDVRALYELLERDLVPAFYDRDADGFPGRWLETARASMRTVCSQFNTHRMVGEYVDRYYRVAHR